MRNRFFFIILTTLILAAIGINLVHVNFFESQRLNLIDEQISDSSSRLLNSKEFLSSVKNPVLVEQTISKVLGGTRIGKVFILRGSDGKIRYESFNVGLLDVEIPLSPEWVTAKTKHEYIRVRNIILPGKESYILQVGLVLDRNFLNWEIIDQKLINYVAGIVLSLFLASALLTVILLTPLRLLSAHLQEVTSNLINMRAVRPLPGRLLRYANGFWSRSDEFSQLLSTVQKLIDRINSNYKLTRSWTFQMAHELKTPLAIMRVDTENLKRQSLLPTKYADDILQEIETMSDIISQFLDWAEIENSQLQKDLHALRIRSFVKNVATRLEKVGSKRIKLSLNSDFSVVSNPAHLDQLITNLVTNALKFSPDSKPVDIEISENALIIRDYGDGFPNEVKERLGEPFNVGPQGGMDRVGNGLGLAWVVAVTKLYNWKFSIESDSSGTRAIVRFPEEIEK